MAIVGAIIYCSTGVGLWLLLTWLSIKVSWYDEPMVPPLLMAICWPVITALEAIIIIFNLSDRFAEWATKSMKDEEKRKHGK